MDAKVKAVAGTLESRLAWYINPDPRLGLPELGSLRVESSVHRAVGSRLNIVLPIVLDQWLYGGIATALRFFRRLGEQFDYQRIILTHQTESEFDFKNWADWVVDRGDIATRSIAFLGDPTTSLSLTPSDYFVATCWHTAFHVKHFLAKQRELFNTPDQRFVYLIQDYEPSFYPWSARHVAARSTYSKGQNIVAVFNTRLLADYFSKSGIHFSEHHAFEPMLHPILRQEKQAIRNNYKERLIIVYGRPTQTRNNFEMLVEGLRIWANSYPLARDWSLVSAGEQHADIPLTGDIALRSCGKLSTEEYARYLSRSWAGVSLMLSPHPSYPPLEMAEFGAWVITNKFENKDLSELAPNIVSIDELTPESIAERLMWCCDQYQPSKTAVMEDLVPVFKSKGEEFPFANNLASSWLETSEDHKATANAN